MKPDFHKPDWKQIAVWCRTALKRFWKVFTRRLWMKLLSLLLAVLLWNYVVTSNHTITRSKTLTGLNGYVTSQSTLATYGLALLDDPGSALTNVTVKLEVAQSDYALASPDNVQVMLDLSSVRTAGAQEVPLKATTTYGKVTGILPESVTLTFETLDSRSVPVSVELTGDKNADRWYSVSRTNPSVVTVSGAASVVRSISQARVYSDVSGVSESYMRAEPYVLLDGEGKEITQSMLTRSSSSITVVTDVYPTKEIPISTDIADVVTGRVAEGYEVKEIVIQPEGITVAADQELLEGLNELLIEPVSVEGLSQSFSARAMISLLSDFKNVSTEQVYVNVTIGEESVSEWVDNVTLSFVGKAENLQLEWQSADIQVYVTGPRSAVEALKQDGIPVTVDLTGLAAGSYSCELRFPTENYPDVSFEPETPALTVTLSAAAAE